MRLRDQPWWPSGWAALGGSSPTHGELSRDGTFVTPRLSSMGLSLAVDYNATQCTAIVTYTVVREAGRPTEFLRLLCGLLENYRGKPFHEVENIDIDTI